MDQIPGQFIIMPKAREGTQASPMLKQSRNKRDRITTILESAAPDGGDVRVTRSKRTADLALVELTDAQKVAVEDANPGLELFPVYRYTLAAIETSSIIAASATLPMGTTSPQSGNFKFVVHDQAGTPVHGATISLWEIAPGEPLTAVTDSRGEATIWSATGIAKLITVSTFSDFWDSYRTGVLASSGLIKFAMHPLSATFVDCFKFHYGDAGQNSGTGVRVAVIDTGVDAHPDLKCVAQRTNLMNSEPDTAVYDNGTGHGTHVAGLIGASGILKGLAPNVEILSYRVFEQGKNDTGTFALMQAIDAAVADGADIINLSLGQQTADEAMRRTVERAIAEGVLVIAAAGNDGGAGVRFPAVMENVVSVGAIGRDGTFPAGTSFANCLKRVKGSDHQDFVPGFSNSGKVNVAAPGVAIVSTVGSNGYTAKNGTSMAAPIVTGIAARILSEEQSLAKLGRTLDRLTSLRELLYHQCNTLGFDVNDVGNGLPQL